ncbi:MAG: HAMP domain-containing histidine kinase [Planctomycetaceae bacterium]|nr:HAMP domain-containing histidine kinase [Planctomycetaceae bacterium]
MSLAARLSTFFLAALALVLLGFSATLYGLARGHLYRQLDERLEAALGTLEAAVDVEPDGLEWEPTDRRMTLGLEPGEEHVRWSVRDSQGRMVDRSENAVGGHFPAGWNPAVWPTRPPDGSAFGDLPGWRLAGRRLRLEDLLRLGRGHPEDDGPEDDVEYPVLILTAGLSPAPVEVSLRLLALSLAGLSSVVWIGSATLGRHLCRRALVPLARMATAAREISAADPEERLPSPKTDDELEDLGRAFNELLARLHEAFERQRRFAGDASHQLRTPLTGLLSLIEVIRRRKRATEDYEQALDQIHAEAVRLRQIVESLLFLARADAEAMIPECELIDLSPWVPEELERWAGHPRAVDLRFEAESEGPLWIRANPPLLSQALDNLIDNACKYSAPGDPITVRTWREGGSIALAVEDCGCGIAAEDMGHLFEPFYRTSQARLQGRPGVGLGLAVVQRIVTAQGGTIGVQSIAGRGSLFACRFPSSNSSTVASVQDSPPARPMIRTQDSLKLREQRAWYGQLSHR